VAIDPEVPAILPPDRMRELQESARNFKAAWRAGQRPTIESYLGTHDGLSRSLLLKELLRLDVHYRRQSGESPSALDYVVQFPESRDLIESLFSETQSLVGQLPPETVLRPAGKPVKPDSSIEATRTSVGAKEDRDRRAPKPSPSEDRSKPIVPLDDFMRVLTDSGLMEQDELDAFIGSLPMDSRPENGKQLAQELHRCKKLTRFQVQAVYQGKTRGLVVGNYVVLDKLGEGGMGQVYKARHKRMDRVVALKVLPAAATKSPESVKRFQREVKAAAKLTHPNIVTAYDADEHRGVYFLVMEYVEGKDLAGFVREKGPLPVKQAVDCIVQAAEGLEYAHKQGIVHRDIKPHNLLLDKSGTVKILDMGLARLDEQMHKQADDDGLTRSGAVMGTLDYMSPEQAMDTKTADARADIYSLGCTLHFLLTGRPPYEGDSLAAKIVAHRTQPVPSLRAKRKDVSEALDAVFQKMLAKKADARQASASEVVENLSRVVLATSESDAFDLGNGSSQQKPALSADSSAEAIEFTPLDDLSDGYVDVTQRWAAPNSASASANGPWVRRRKVLLIASSVATTLGMLIVIVGAIVLRTKVGELALNVSESGADVQIIDGTGAVKASIRSVTKDLTVPLPPGNYQLRVRKDGYQESSEAFSVASGSKTPIAVKLAAQVTAGTLVVRVREPGALVEVTDPSGRVEATYRDVADAVSVSLPRGTHGVSVTKAGFQPYASSVEIKPTAETPLEVALEPIPKASVNVPQTPTDAKLAVVMSEADLQLQLLDGAGKPVVDRASVTGTQELTAPPGRYSLRIQKFGFPAFSQDVTLAAGDALTLTPSIESFGQVRDIIGPTAQTVFAAEEVPANIVISHDDREAGILTSAGRVILRQLTEAGSPRGVNQQHNSSELISNAADQWNRAFAVSAIDGCQSGYSIFAIDKHITRGGGLEAPKPNYGYFSYHVRSDKDIVSWDVHDARIENLHFSASGKFFVSSSSDGTVGLFDTEKQAQIVRIGGHSGPVHDAVIAPDGTCVASGGEDGQLRLSSTADGKPLGAFSLSTPIRSVSITPDSKRIVSACADGVLRAVEISTGKVLEMKGNLGTLNRVISFPVGPCAVAGGSDGVLRVWDVSKGNLLLSLPGHNGEITGIAFDSAGRNVYSTGKDKSLRQWRLPQGVIPPMSTSIETRVASAVLSKGGGVWTRTEYGDGMEPIVSHRWLLTAKPDVARVEFHNNKDVSDDDLALICSLPNLRILVLNRTPLLTPAGLQCIRSLKRVEQLSLAGNAAADDTLIPALGEIVTNVTSLDLSDTGVTDAGISQLKTLLDKAGNSCALRSLTLSSLNPHSAMKQKGGITEKGFASLAQRPAIPLESLTVRVWSIHGQTTPDVWMGAIVAQISQLKTLNELDLTNARPPASAIEQLALLPKLRLLGLREPNTSEGDLAKVFAAARPSKFEVQGVSLVAPTARVVPDVAEEKRRQERAEKQRVEDSRRREQAEKLRRDRANGGK
jgi:serine/threonine protein kinase/WD40 repeat protein